MKRSELFFSFLHLPVDAAAIFFSFLLAYQLRVKTDIIPAYTNVLLKDYLWSGVYLLPVWLVFFALAGLYNVSRQRNLPNKLYKIFISSSAAILLLIVYIFLGKVSFFSRLILVYTWALSIILVFFGRVIIDQIRTLLFRYDIGVRRTICIGANECTQKIISLSNQNVSLGMKVIGVLNGAKNHDDNGLKIIGEIGDLESIIKSRQVDEVILTDMSIPESQINALVLVCADNNVDFKFIPNTFFMITSHVDIKELVGLPMMEIRSTPLDGWGRIAKRVFDIVISVMGLVVSLPFSIIAIIGTKLTSEGPIFYTHDRVGRDGKTFRLIKFRSMYKDAEKNGRFWTEKNDNRITPFGRFLRKTNIDEIPQFANVLKGDMSFVGPRPEQPAFVEKFQKEIPEYFRRHRVKSGLTGWAQANGLKGDTSIQERVRYDIFYIENWSLWFDMKIILKTVVLIIKEMVGGKYEYRHNS